MLGRTNNSSPIPDPPEPRVIEEFNVHGTGGPSKRLGRLRLDLDGSVRSPWNMKAGQRFRKSFNKSQLYRRWPNDLVEEAFLRHIETIRTNYYKQTGRVPASTTAERQIRSARRSRVKTVSITSSHIVLVLIRLYSSFAIDGTSATSCQTFPDSRPTWTA